VAARWFGRLSSTSPPLSRFRVPHHPGATIRDNTQATSTVWQHGPVVPDCSRPAPHESAALRPCTPLDMRVNYRHVACALLAVNGENALF
jgi:hypothetical protein